LWPISADSNIGCFQGVDQQGWLVLTCVTILARQPIATAWAHFFDAAQKSQGFPCGLASIYTSPVAPRGI
jgi:hypothetical protein